MKTRVALILMMAWGLGPGLVYGQRAAVEVKAQYFQPLDRDFRDIYHPRAAFGGEIDVSLSKDLGVWAGGHRFSSPGKLTFTGEGTRIRISPLYGGLRFRFGERTVIPYVGAGIGLFSFKERNPIGTVHGSAFGMIGQGGIIFRIGNRIFVDLKGSFTSSTANPAGIEGQLGGLQVGLGVGLFL
jgi:opacity protein-like surface antigen